MKIRITRTGGFAGRTLGREVDTAKVRGGRQIEKLAERARRRPASPARTPDAFAYEIVIDGTTYVTGGDDPAWGALIERLFATPGLQ